jgi:hypothetical protein
MLYQQRSYFIMATKACQLRVVYHRGLGHLQSSRSPAVFRLVKYHLLAIISVLTTEVMTLAGLIALCNSIEPKQKSNVTQKSKKEISDSKDLAPSPS